MFIIDNETGEKFAVENIRCMELKFDTIIAENNQYKLLNHEQLLIAIVEREHVDSKTRSKLDSLAEYNIGEHRRKS